MTVYGIKNCDSVRKTLKFLKDNEIEFDFVDFKKEQVDDQKIKQWATKNQSAH